MRDNNCNAMRDNRKQLKDSLRMSRTIRGDIWRRWNSCRYVFFNTSTQGRATTTWTRSEWKRDHDGVSFFHRIIPGKSLREKRCTLKELRSRSLFYLPPPLSWLLLTHQNRPFTFMKSRDFCVWVLRRHTNTHPFRVKKETPRKERWSFERRE